MSSATPTPTPTMASAPLYPLLPPLPVYNAPDPLYQEKVAYGAALAAGAKVTDTAGREMFASYLKHIESGCGKEGQFHPLNIEDNTKLCRGVMSAFKVLVEAVDPSVEVVIADDSCDVKLRDTAVTPAPSTPTATPAPVTSVETVATTEILSEAQRAFAGSSSDKTNFLNNKLRRLQVGDLIWLRSHTGSSVYKLAKLTKFNIERYNNAGNAEATFTSSTETVSFYWGTGYDWPLVNVVFLPCWDQRECLALLNGVNGSKLVQSDVASSASLSIGDCVGVTDTHGKKYLSHVIETDANRVKIHYFGWADKWDEWIDRTSSRIGPKLDLTTVNARAKKAVPENARLFLKGMGAYFKNLSYKEVAQNLRATGNLNHFSFLLHDKGNADEISNKPCGTLYALLEFGAFTLTIWCEDVNKTPNCTFSVEM